MFITLSSVGNMLTFMVGSKQAFEVALPDVAQTQMQGKTDVLLEFHVDDTTGANEVCSSCSGSSHIFSIFMQAIYCLWYVIYLLIMYISSIIVLNFNPSWL